MKRTGFMMRIGAAAAIATLTAVLAGCQQPGFRASAGQASGSPAPGSAPPPSAPSGTASYIGTYEASAPQSWQLTQKFTAATGVRPNIVLYYSGWYEKFRTSFADTAHAHGAMPFVDIQPDHVSVLAIATGRYDSYLRSYAEAVRSFGYPVVISFGHEMNGNWYPWGAGHTSPAIFRAAWKHIVSVFRSEGASNVIWLWTVDSISPVGSTFQEWWPGSAWVNWVGLDGYYYRPSDTFASVFGDAIKKIRAFTHGPILISETAVGPVAGPSKIADLFAGVRRDDLLGLVWFDRAQHGGIAHQDWRLEDSPAALAAFREAAAAFEKHAPPDTRS